MIVNLLRVTVIVLLVVILFSGLMLALDYWGYVGNGRRLLTRGALLQNTTEPRVDNK